MPLLDRIRARVREKDCFIAIFPEDGFSILSPMNDKIFPVPNSAQTGCRDIDDGMATLTHNSLATSDAFDFISGNYGSRFYLKANLSGRTPHHTLMMRAFLTDTTNVTEYPYIYRVIFCHNGGTSYLNHANLSCSIEIDGQNRFYGIKSYACFQNSSEFGSGSTVTRSDGSIKKAYARESLSGRWLTVATSVDQTTRIHRLYLNGEEILSESRASWTSDRNMFSCTSDYNSCWLGHSYATKEFYGITSRVAWAATFSSVLSAEEIKFLSEE